MNGNDHQNQNPNKHMMTREERDRLITQWKMPTEVPEDPLFHDDAYRNTLSTLIKSYPAWHDMRNVMGLTEEEKFDKRVERMQSRMGREYDSETQTRMASSDITRSVMYLVSHFFQNSDFETKPVPVNLIENRKHPIERTDLSGHVMTIDVSHYAETMRKENHETVVSYDHHPWGGDLNVVGIPRCSCKRRMSFGDPAGRFHACFIDEERHESLRSFSQLVRGKDRLTTHRESGARIFKKKDGLVAIALADLIDLSRWIEVMGINDDRDHVAHDRMDVRRGIMGRETLQDGRNRLSIIPREAQSFYRGLLRRFLRTKHLMRAKAHDDRFIANLVSTYQEAKKAKDPVREAKREKDRQILESFLERPKGTVKDARALKTYLIQSGRDLVQNEVEARENEARRGKIVERSKEDRKKIKENALLKIRKLREKQLKHDDDVDSVNQWDEEGKDEEDDDTSSR
jgi:hypothetical protein